MDGRLILRALDLECEARFWTSLGRVFGVVAGSDGAGATTGESLRLFLAPRMLQTEIAILVVVAAFHALAVVVVGTAVPVRLAAFTFALAFFLYSLLWTLSVEVLDRRIADVTLPGT